MRDYDDDDDVVEKGGSTFSAFLWGALLGAGAMLLFAPRSGRETRQELSDSFRRLKDTADAAIRDVQESVSETVSGMRGQVDATRTAFDASREAARGARTDLGQRWEQGREGVRSAYRSRPGAPARESEEE